MKFRSITQISCVLVLLLSPIREGSNVVLAEDKESEKPNGEFVPPYTDDDNIPNKDKITDKTDKIIGVRPDKCLGLVLSDSNNLGPYQAGVIKGLVYEMRANTDAEY